MATEAVEPRAGWRGYLTIAAAGAAVRFAYLFAFARRASVSERYLYDSFYYRLEAVVVAKGRGFVDPGVLFVHMAHPLQSADHPPVTVALLTPIAYFFGASTFPMRVAFTVLGVVNVVLIALLAERFGGRRVAYTAGAIASLYPFLWVNDGLIMSETPTVTVVVLLMLLSLRLRDTPTTRRALALGAVVGVGILTRSEMLVLGPALVVWCVLTVRDADRRTRLRLGAWAAVAAVVVLAPWTVYNESRFNHPVLVSTNFGLNLLGGSCDEAFYGPKTGLLGPDCVPKQAPRGDASYVAEQYQTRAIAYTRRHLSRYPVVVAARMGRTWSLFRPFDMLHLNTSEGRPSWVTALGLIWYYPLALLAIGGAFVLRRRRIAVFPLLAAPLAVTVAAFVSWGQIRYRVAAEPSIVILASCALVAWFDRVRRPAGQSEVVTPPDGDANDGSMASPPGTSSLSQPPA